MTAQQAPALPGPWTVGCDGAPSAWFIWRRIADYPHTQYVETTSGDIRFWKSHEAAERNRVLIERMAALRGTS